jgi:hypothetical protein
MGLDITAYRQLKLAPDAAIDEGGNPAEWQKFWRPGASMDWSEKNWLGRAKGIANSNALYSFAEEFDFQAGSYSGYNDWRNWLAQVAGWRSAEDAWKAGGGAFFELIYFSDSEGVIGSEVSAKLAEDFAEYDEKARSMGEDGYRYKKYQEWRRAFEMAADGGAVDFH